MVHTLLRWAAIAEYLDGNDFNYVNFASQLDVELLQSAEADDIEMEQGISLSQLEGELLQIFQQDDLQMGQFVDWLLDQIEGPSNELDEEQATAVVSGNLMWLDEELLIQ